jgi:hypothetical protein
MLMGLICVWYKNFNDNLDLFKMVNKNIELTKQMFKGSIVLQTWWVTKLGIIIKTFS